jgi:hypothetical protein
VLAPDVVVMMPELEVVVVPAACVVVVGFASHFFDIGFSYGADVDGHINTHARVPKL